MNHHDIVLITGAGRGIGATMAECFTATGHRVVVADIDLSTATATAAALPGALAVELDVVSPTSVRSVFDLVRRELGPIGVLVNNATVCADADFATMELEQWKREIEVNLTGPFLCSQAVLPQMVERGGGAIINMSSVNAVSYFGNEAYSAAKAGLMSLTRSLAVKYGPQGIRCNAVIPGTIQTPVWDARLAADPSAIDRLAKWYPAGRVGTSDDVASAVLFLASPAASWISGASLPVDGGLLAGNKVMADEVTQS